MDELKPPALSPEGSSPKRAIVSSLIDHTYHNFSTDTDEEIDLELERRRQQQLKDADANEKDLPTAHRRGAGKFPRKLHEIVSNPEYRHIIRWMPHGRSWAVLDKELLEKVVLPSHFSHASFASFNRSVNGWGFKVS